MLVRRVSTWRILSAGAAAVTLVATGALAGPYLTPKPVYPESARQRRITGSGIFKLDVSVKTGQLKRVKIVRSTGNRALDAAAVWALLHWRFKPGVRCVYVPVSFTITSVAIQGGRPPGQ
ncbi:MAG: hypothetical protein DMG84_23280 [Acidobacteria bacterium]|nr:MAG: hypothetical protein DMG84_23280 [Acidobacteriota bacterium]